MERKTLVLYGPVLALLCVAGLVGQLAAEEASPGRDGAPEPGNAIVACTGWMNCDAESPNYTGFCCRCCTHENGRKAWECKEVFAGEQGRDALPAGPRPAGEATLAGIVTRQGLLEADDGQAYAVAGNKAKELHGHMGKKIEVKGTVEEVQGKVTIDVQTYELMRSQSAATDTGSTGDDAFGSCTEWKNCNSRPPTYTGTCCRQCEDEQGGKRWDCRAFSVGEYFNLAEWLAED